MNEGYGLSRLELTKYLEDHLVQTRNLFAGNIIYHPCFDEIRDSDAYRVAGDLTVTDNIMNNAFWIGVYPGMTNEKIDYMTDMIKNYLKEKGY